MGRGYNLLVNDGVIDTSDLLSGLYILVLKINDAEYRTTIVILK
jgi:hypothetical protein